MNSSATFDILGIGNAIVDVLSFTDEAFIAKHGFSKGAMTLIDQARAEQLYREMGQATECSGGSAANTLAAFSSLGGKAAFVGKVRDDQLGEIFRHDLRAIGVAFDTPPAKTGPATARCYIFVTPGGERTMNTFLGACGKVTEEDIDEADVARSKIVYVEGYLWDAPEAKAAIVKALISAKEHNVKVAFTLSDVFCVERHRAEFLELIEEHIDILFANEHELNALYGTASVNDAVMRLRGKCEIAAVTCSEKGSIIVTKETIEHVPAEPVKEVVDSTGAGDLYAAGFLYGMTHGMDLKKSGELASRCAAEIIQQLGARTMKPLSRLLK